MLNVQFCTNPGSCFDFCYFLIQNHLIFPSDLGYLVLASSAVNLNHSCVLEVNDHLSYEENVLLGVVDDKVGFVVDGEEENRPLWMGDIVEAEIALDMGGYRVANERDVVINFVRVTLVVVVVERDFWRDVSAVSPLIPMSIVFFVGHDHSFLFVGNGVVWVETRRLCEKELCLELEKLPWRS